MFFVSFKCTKCGEMFRVLRMLVSSDTTRTCPKCGATEVPPVEDDLLKLRLEEKEGCTSFG